MRLNEAGARIRPADADAMAQANARQARLTKPAGSLGTLEELSVRLAGIAGTCPPPVPVRPVVAVFAGDHGVHAQDVSPWPQEVTAQMVANFAAGGAVVNAFARQAGVAVTVVDVGVASPYPRRTRGRPASGPSTSAGNPGTGPRSGRSPWRRRLRQSRPASPSPPISSTTATTRCSPATWASQHHPGRGADRRVRQCPGG